MSVPTPAARKATENSAALLLDALPHPVLLVDADGHVSEANSAAEDFFQVSIAMLRRQPLANFVPFGSPLLALIEQVRMRGSAVNEYRVDVGTPRNGSERIVDIYASPILERPNAVVVMLQERTMAEKIDRQLTHRGAARSVTGLAAMLAHEIKNPLSGIRGAAQLLEASVGEADRELAVLIRDEADRIRALVDRMEVFGEKPVERRAVNIHRVLEHVRRLAQSGFAAHLRISEVYDPSLPPVNGNRDQLVQVLLNLVKNAAEAITQGPFGSDVQNGEIVLTTAYQHGMRLAVPGSDTRMHLPLVVSVRDNGPGIGEDIRPNLFDPFVSSKPSGSGLGLALVAKIVADHGGLIEVDSRPGRTEFRLHLPMLADDRADLG